jgi:hypothetical protein
MRLAFGGIRTREDTLQVCQRLLHLCLAFSRLLVETGLHELLMNLEETFIKLSLEPTADKESAGAYTHHNMVKAILDACPLRLLGVKLLLYLS